MKSLLLIPLLLLVACSSPETNTEAFDKYLEQLMAEPYDPINGSKY